MFLKEVSYASPYTNAQRGASSAEQLTHHKYTQTAGSQPEHIHRHDLCDPKQSHEMRKTFLLTHSGLRSQGQ